MKDNSFIIIKFAMHIILLPDWPTFITALQYDIINIALVNNNK